MTITGYLCIDPNKGFVADQDDDYTPLIELKFVGVKRLSRDQKLEIMGAAASKLHEVLSSEVV